MSVNDVLAGAGGTNLLPREVSTEIWKTAMDEAVVPRLAKSTPVTLGDNIVPTVTKRPAASIVGEGENKPVSQLEFGAKTFKPIKAVVGCEFSMEALVRHPSLILDELSTELSGALARQIDLAVIHGKQASDGAALSGSPEKLLDTTNEVNIDGADGADKALWDGYGLVVAKTDFTGFAADPQLVALLASARDKDGRRTNPDIQMGSAALSTFSGLPFAVSKTVGGKVDAATPEKKVYAIGGNFEALRFGRALEIPVKRIEYGDPFGNGDLQRRNAVAFMAEVLFGWVILDKDAFVKYTAA